MKILKKLFEILAFPFETLSVLIDESRRGGIDGTNCYEGGEHK